MSRIFLILLFISAPYIYSQKDINISSYLKEIDAGNSSSVLNSLSGLKKKSPGAPSLLYLEGVLTEDGTTAAALFTSLVDKHPFSAYADAAAYRLYSYYYSMDNKVLTTKYSSLMKRDYSTSPYTKLLNRTVTEPTVKSDEFNYTVQAGAFSNHINAEALRKKFSRAGYHTYVKDKNIGGTIFKIVFAGRFKTRSEAESFQLIINREYGLKGIVAKYQE
jgi:hypothetical protein